MRNVAVPSLMAFPRRLLHDGEEVVLDLRPHWSSLGAPSVGLIAALSSLVTLAALPAPEWLQLLAGALTLVALARFVLRYLRWAGTSFLVTTDRLVHRRGMLAKEGMEIPLEGVNTVLFRQSLRERLMRCGDLVIDSGGEGGRQSFSDIPHPSRVQAAIHEQMERSRSRTSGRFQRGLSVVEQLERLDDLCRRGVLSRPEFELQKAQLLER